MMVWPGIEPQNGLPAHSQNTRVSFFQTGIQVYPKECWKNINFDNSINLISNKAL